MGKFIIKTVLLVLVDAGLATLFAVALDVSCIGLVAGGAALCLSGLAVAVAGGTLRQKILAWKKKCLPVCLAGGLLNGVGLTMIIVSDPFWADAGFFHLLVLAAGTLICLAIGLCAKNPDDRVEPVYELWDEEEEFEEDDDE